MGEAQIGTDVVLREKEAQTKLLKLLPTKAQLGFSSLKQHFSQRGDLGVKRFLQASKPHDAIKLEYTCIDATEEFVVLGCNFGILFFFDRKLGRLQRFVAETKQAPTICVKILPSQNFVVSGQFNGALTIFNYGKEKDGNYKVLFKCTVDDHHKAPVTCVEWTPDGTKLFSGDSEGNVAISVLNMDNGQTHTVFICKENSPITQLSLCQTALVVSTLRRSLIWPFNLKTPVQVGQQERKVHGNFGACFFQNSKDSSSNLLPIVYAARPGLRIWRANVEGKVSTTMIFKDSIMKGEPAISTLDLPSINSDNGVQSEPKQFGPLVVYADDYLLSWQGSCVWVLDPNSGHVAGCHSNFGCVVDVATANEDIFILTKGDNNFVRRISLNIRAQSPIIEVRELNLLEEESNAKIPRAGSVSQFEESDKLEKIIGDVMSTTVGFISGVKRNVVKTIDYIKARDDSEEERSSSGDSSSSSMTTSSPITIVRRRNVNSSSPKTVSVESGELSVASPCVIISPPKNEEGLADLLNGIELNEIKSESIDQERSGSQSLNQQESNIDQQEGDSERTVNSTETEIDVVITHDLKEKQTPFHHLSERGFSSDIVFEGTSKQKPKRKKKKLKGAKGNVITESLDGEKTSSSIKQVNGVAGDGTETRDTSEIANESSRSRPTCNEEDNQTLESGKTKTESLKIVRESDANLDGNSGKRIEDSANGTESLGGEAENENNKKSNAVNTGTGEAVVDENIIESANKNTSPQTTTPLVQNIMESNAAAEILLENSIQDKKEYREVLTTVSPEDSSESHEFVSKSNSAIVCRNAEVVSVEKGDISEALSAEQETASSLQFSEVADERPNIIVTSNEPILQNNDLFTTPAEELNADDLFGVEKDVERNRRPQEARKNLEPLFDPSEVLNVEIATEKQIKRNTQLMEPCKKVDGEAVERTHFRSGSSGCVYLGNEDTIDSNMCWLDEDDERIDLDHSPPASPVSLNQEPSLFPAPQMKYQSIYSQDTISLSEMSFSEPEHEIPPHTERPRDDTLIDSLSMLSIDSSELTDVEDNRCPTPPINLDSYGGVELTEAIFLQHKYGGNSRKDSARGSDCSSPSVIDGPMPSSPHSMAEKLSERLRLLADSWAEISVPNCGCLQSIAVTDTLIWCVDSHEHIFITAASSASVSWRKIDGKARQISANQAGTIIWSVNRKKVASYRSNIRTNNPQGGDWETVENEVLEVAVDDTAVWGIRTNGDVFIRTGVSPQKPEGTGWKSVRAASDLVHVTCLGSMVWGLDIYNHVQIYQGNISTLGGNEQAIQWMELPGITASYVTLGPKGVCWIIDKDGKIWFNLEISEENFFGGKWYELSVGEYLVQDPTVLSTVVSFFKRGNEPKILAGNDISGIWILGKYGSLHAARGHLLGTRWDLTVPIAMAPSTFWTCVSAQGATGNGGFIWALQPTGDLHCFRPESKSSVVQPPPRTVLKFISASPRSLWALTNNQDVYIRRGISETAPQGLKWMIVDMCSMGSERICSIACGILVVWAVDFHGNVWFQMGKEDNRKGMFSPAWIQVEGSPFDGCRFTKVAVGSNDCMVWAVDDKNNVYARRDVSESFLIGTSWEVVAGTGAKDIAISDNLVWALCPNGNIVCRFGISPKNFVGDYWKTVPGCFEHISVSADDELWGIDRQGQLYKRHTVHFFGTQATRKVPSYSQLFPTDDDWELI